MGLKNSSLVTVFRAVIRVHFLNSFLFPVEAGLYVLCNTVLKSTMCSYFKVVLLSETKHDVTCA